MDRQTITEALEASGNERIECPVCGEEIRAFELATDHAHSNELLRKVLRLLNRPRPAGLADDSDDEGGGNLRETIIRNDPENVTKGEFRDHLRRIDEAETNVAKGSIPERRVFGVEDEADYERISEAAWGVAKAFVGSPLHAGHELVACPDFGYEGHVDQTVFPGVTAHSADAETEGE